MRSSEGVEVDWGDVLEELALVENADEVSADESTKTVPSDRKFRHSQSASLEVLHFFEDLEGSGGIELHI